MSTGAKLLEQEAQRDTDLNRLLTKIRKDLFEIQISKACLDPKPRSKLVTLGSQGVTLIVCCFETLPSVAIILVFFFDVTLDVVIVKQTS